MSSLLLVVLAYLAVAALACVILLAPFVLIGLVLVALGRWLGISCDGGRLTRRQD